MKICVAGLWHLGCVTAACMAKKGIQVIGIADDEYSCNQLMQGKAPLYEPGLDELLAENIRSGRLSFTTDIKTAVEESDYIWVCVDTPVKEDDTADVESVIDRIKTMLRYSRNGQGYIVSSQVPVGTIKQIENYLHATNADLDVRFAYSPENLRLGKALDIFCNPDRIVIGVRCEDDKPLFASVFNRICERQEWMHTESAEMTKHAINSFLATSVVFINEIASLCEAVGADAKEVSRGLKTEERIGPKAYLSPGASFAGGTLARDLLFLKKKANEYGIELKQIHGTYESNLYHKDWVYHKLQRVWDSFNGKTVGIFGLAYKKGTSTLRRSLAVELAKKISVAGGKVIGYDPNVKELPEGLIKILSLADTLQFISQNADALVVMTDHDAFWEPLLEGLQRSIPILDENGYFAGKIEKEDPQADNYFTVGRGIFDVGA